MKGCARGQVLAPVSISTMKRTARQLSPSIHSPKIVSLSKLIRNLGHNLAFPLLGKRTNTVLSRRSLRLRGKSTLRRFGKPLSQLYCSQTFLGRNLGFSGIKGLLTASCQEMSFIEFNDAMKCDLRQNGMLAIEEFPSEAVQYSLEIYN